jgi:hypothetical protein
MGIIPSPLLAFAFLFASLLTISFAQNLIRELEANGIALLTPGDNGFGSASAACELIPVYSIRQKFMGEV